MSLAAIVCAVLVSIQENQGDWPQWRGALGDGLSHGGSWSAEGRTLWSAEIDLGYSAPAVGQGRVLTLGFDVARGLDVLRCLDFESGKELWRAEHPGELRNNQHEGGTLSSPAIAGERVFFASTDGVLRCLELADGTALWTADLAERHGVDPGYYGFASSPVLAGGEILIAVDRALAIDPATGTTVWASEPLAALYSTPVACSIRGEERVAVFSQDALHLLERAGGKQVAAFPWKKGERRVNASTPILIGERLFVSSAYEHGCALVEFAPEGPRALFENRRMRNKMSGGVALEGLVFGFDEGVLRCLDLEGEEHWHVRGLGCGALAGGDGKLAILSSAGELVVARASGAAFEELSRTPLFEDGVCWTPPVIAHGRILARNNHGRLVCREHRGTSTAASATAARPSAAALPDAASLCERHLAAIGGAEVLARHAGLRIAGTYEQRSVGFVPAPFEILYTAPDRRRVQIRFPPPLDERFAQDGVKGHLARIHDGEQSFVLNRYLGDKLLEGGEAAEERIAARLGAAAEWRTLYAELTTRARVEFDRRDCYAVDARTPDGRVRTLHFEVESGLLAGREAPDEALVTYRDYRPFDGLALPTTQRVFRPDGGIEELFRVERVEAAEVADSAFARSEAIDELLRALLEGPR